jgi:ribulose-phosphate 3-epimerase
MIDDPLKYGPIFVHECGVQLVNFHVEISSNPVAVARELRQLGVRIGVTLKPQTPAEAVFPVLEEVDMVLVMSVEPGFGGQKFMPEMLDKVAAIKRRMHPGQRIEIDGGIDTNTIVQAYEAGADWFVAGSSIFGKVDRARAIEELRAHLAKVRWRQPELEAK